MSENVIIIGAGASGLTAGIYALDAGFGVTILERGSRSGGVQGSWKRGGYHFEGSLHWLIGCRNKTMPVYGIYTRTGILSSNNPIHYGDPVYAWTDGTTTARLLRDLPSLRRELVAASPSDAGAIDRLVGDIRHPFVPHRLLRLLRTSAGQYLSCFSDGPVKGLLGDIVNPDHNALALIYVLSRFAARDAGYLDGGSSRMVANMEERFRSKGGKILFGCEALRVETEGGRVKGVATRQGMLAASAVIVTSDTRKAVDKLFEKPLRTKWADALRRDTVPEQCVLVCLGVRCDLSALPEALHCRLKTPVQVAGQTLSELTVYNYAFCPEYAPEGCTALTVLVHSQSYQWWTLAKARGEYDKCKQEVISAVVRSLSEIIPQIQGNVEVTDMTTPLTYERYCDCFQGGWMSIWEAGKFPRILPARGPVRGLYFAGERTMITGGIPVAVQSAVRAVAALKRDSKTGRI